MPKTGLDTGTAARLRVHAVRVAQFAAIWPDSNKESAIICDEVPLVAMDEPRLFLSYSNADRPSVVGVRKLLAARSITTFLDRYKLVPGMPWPQALEEALRGVRAVAVFIGRELDELGFVFSRLAAV